MPGTLKEIGPGSNGPDLLSIKFSRRDLLRLTAAAGAGALAAAAEPAVNVLTALAAPLEGGGGGADALKVLPEEIQQLLADKTPVPITMKKSFRLWKEPNDANQSLVIVRVDDKDTVTGYAVTPNDWFFGTRVDDKDPDQVPKWGFFTKEREEYVDFDENLAEQMVRLNADQIKAIQKALWPQLPTPSEQPSSGEITSGQEVFRDNFAGDQVDFGYGIWRDGTEVTLVPDPLNKRGNVMQVAIIGDPVRYDGWGQGLFWYTGYPWWQNGPQSETLPAPCSIEVDCMVAANLPRDMGLLSVHRLNKATGDKISNAGLELYMGGFLKLVVCDGQGIDTRIDLRPGSVKLGIWNKLRLVFLPDGSVMPYINNEPAYKKDSPILNVPVDGEHDAGFCDGHAGLIWANQNPSKGPPIGFSMWNSNFCVRRL